ncbi:MAG TPA: hypothetical protein VFR67_09745, partial [Pilimelia sp.]|nr:hypothetical protein [Pilimelia sp.]
MLSVEPGEIVSTTATIHNLGSQVEQFAMSVLGPAAAWATTEPATLQIYPAGHAECTIRLAPPREVTTPAGQVWFTVQAMSTLHPGLVASANGTLDVGAFREVTAVLVPQQTSGRGRTQHRVDITNAGNVVEPVRIEASDPAGKVKFGVPPGEVPLPPGKHAVAVPVRPPLRWFKKPSQTPFTVMVTPRPTLAAIRLDGTREIMPLIGGWLPKVAVAVAGLAVVAAALLLVPGSPLNQTGGGGDPTASPSPPGQTPPTGGTATATPTAPASPTPQNTTSPTQPGQQAAPTQRIVVNYDGRRERGTDGGAVTRLGTGQWEVTFPFDMRNCAYVATIGDPASQLVFNPGLVFTASGRNSDKGVYVETRTTNGSLSDYPFHLVTRCG